MLGMDAKDLQAVGGGRQGHLDHAVEATRPAYCGVEHVLTVRGRHPYHTLVAAHSVHLDEQLIERDFLLSGTVGPPASAAKRVELVDEDNARRLLAGAFGQRAHPSSAYTHVHLIEVGAGGNYHRHSCLAGDRAGEKGLTRSRRADQQNSLWASRADGPKPLRIAQVGNHISQVSLCFSCSTDRLHGQLA